MIFDERAHCLPQNIPQYSWCSSCSSSLGWELDIFLQLLTQFPMRGTLYCSALIFLMDPIHLSFIFFPFYSYSFSSSSSSSSSTSSFSSFSSSHCHPLRYLPPRYCQVHRSRNFITLFFCTSSMHCSTQILAIPLIFS